MNIWNRLGDLAKGTRDWVGDIALGAVSLTGAKFAWDVFTAPMNTDEQFNGFFNSVKNAGVNTVKNIARPFGGVIGATIAVGESAIRQPLSAGLMFAAEPTQGLGKAIENRQEVSIGQAASNLLAKSSPLRLLPDSLTPALFDDKFNIYDSRQRKAAFKDSLYGRYTSGTLDAAAQIFLDPTIILGKATAAAKAADKASDAIFAINEVKTTGFGATSTLSKRAERYAKLAEDFAANDSIWAMNHPLVKSSNNQATVSYLLGTTTTKEEAINTLAALFGDKSAIDALDILKRPDIAVPMRIANGEVSISDLKTLLNEESALMAGQDETMLPLLLRTPEEIAADRAYITAWGQHDKYLAQLTETPFREGIGRFGQAIGREVATARSLPFHAKEVTSFSRSDVYQPTPFHTMYSRISWLENERPSGMVNLNEGDSIREVTAVVNRLVALSKPGNVVTRVFGDAGFSRAEGMKVINAYAAAASPEARAQVINNLESRGYQVISKKNGIDTATAEKLYNTHINRRTGLMRELKEEGYLYDHIEKRMTKVPLFESQTANFLPVADFDTIEKVIRRNKSAISAVSFKASELAAVTSDIWKASVLLRLGYPIRNAVDSQLRIWATVGAMASLRHLAEGGKNVMQNATSSRIGNRLVDRFDRVGKLELSNVKKSVSTLDSEVKLAENNLKILTESLKSNPNDLDLIGRIAVEKNKLAAKMAALEDNQVTLRELMTEDVTKKKTIGTGQWKVSSKYSDAEGSDYTVWDGFGGPNGGLYQQINSSDRSFSALMEDYSTLYSASVRSKGQGAVFPGQKDYYLAWANALNTDFANSAVVRELIAGKKVEDVAKWLEENKTLRTRMGIQRGDSMEHVAQVKHFVDNYIPNGYGIREEMLGPYAALKSKFPNLRDYKDGGMGGLPETKSVVGFVDTNYLAQMPGNITDKEGVDFYVKKLRSGEGFDNPIMVIYDNETGLAFIGEGNHRLQAAIKEGLSGVPVRVVRGRVDATKKLDSSGIGLGADTVGRKPMQVKNGKTLPYTTRGIYGDIEYMPTDVHPSYIFDKEFIVNPDTMQVPKVSEEFLRKAIPDETKLPVVHGHLIEENINWTSKMNARTMTNFLFKWLATKPEDAWARHPLFIDLYRKSINDRVATAEALKGGKFTREEFDNIQYALEKDARADALKGVKDILYNVERRTNAAHMLRYVSPFFSAQENAIKTWLKIASDKPVVISRAATIWNSPNRSGLVTNSDGEPVSDGSPFDGSETIWLPVPGGLKKIPILGEGLSSLDQVGISKRSLDVVFQGNPFGVSIGPLTAIPVSKIIKMKPEFGEVVSFAFPYGPDDSVKQFLPTWGRRLFDMSEGLNNSDYAKMYQLIWITEQHKSRDEQRAYLTEGQVKKKVDAYYKMRAAANLILPFSPQFASPYRFYMDQWRVYSQQYGLGADAKFLEDFPEFFDFATSLSKNPTGSQATMDSVQNAKRYSGLISSVSGDNMNLVGLITNGSNAAKYSPTAYWWQSETTISPGTTETFRGRQTPLEAAAKNQARKGWATYRKVTAVLDAHLADRGLTSYEQNGAEDLKAVKVNLINELSKDIDPATGKPTGSPSAWAQDYRDFDGLKTSKTIQGLRKIISNENFMKDNGSDPTWKSVALYIQARDSVASLLAGRASSNISSKANMDLRLMLDYYVTQLKNGDKEFADIYERFLSQDAIYDKMLGLSNG